MRILDKYILKSVIFIFFSSLFLFFFLYIIIDIFGHLDEIIRQSVPIIILKDYYLSLLPTIFIQVAPIACLLSVLFSLGKLNSNNEIIAMRSTGLNSWQISKSVISFAILISLFIFIVNEKIIPHTVITSNKIKKEYIESYNNKKDKRKVKINNLTCYGLGDRLYFIESFDPNDNSLEGITILEQDKNQNITSKIFAIKGKWQKNRWKFYQCQIFHFDKEGKIIKESQYFEEKIMKIAETPKDFTRQQIHISFMNIEQLKDYISRFSGSGAKTIIQNLKVELHQRTAYPFSNLVIAFVGLPFALMKRKRKGITFTSIGICIAVGFLYYVTNAISIALGKAGLLLPIVSAWLANLMFLFIAIYLLKKIS